MTQMDADKDLEQVPNTASVWTTRIGDCPNEMAARGER
jgi:hypothetical protein